MERQRRFGDRGEWEAVAKQLAKEEQTLQGAGLVSVAPPVAPGRQDLPPDPEENEEADEDGDEETERERRMA